MRAAVFHGADRPMSIEDIATPKPGPGEILVRVAGCGVCHTDLHYIDHGTPTFKKPPLVLGHEIAGTVASPDPTGRFQEGDPVLLPAVLSCGSCTACRTGRENICEHSIMLGNNVDGGYAEFIAVGAKDVFPLPPEIPLVDAAIIADALTTPYHAVINRGRVLPGDRVVVIGCGGVGINVVQIAAALGARVVAIDRLETKREWARRFGAEVALDPAASPRLDRVIREVTGGGADVVFEVVGRPETQELAVTAARTGGRIVLVGYSPDAMSLNSGRVMFRELEVIGSLGCRPVDYPRVIELVRQGRVRMSDLVTHRYSLDDIGDAFAALRDGTAMRSVVVPA
ncbi:MAG TPA: zinc-binding dehydrogenase [Longimicrobiales bacterium]|nr:zinc-binding dehydrogenase [Longimicrobiales bacterium]